VQVHQGGDLDLQPRHRLGDALIARVRPCTGDQRAAHQLGGKHDGSQCGQLAQRFWRHGRGGPVVRLTDLDVEQHRQPDHRHRRHQVNGDRPPEQAGEHGDAADHGLHHRRRRHQPGVDQHLAATAGPGDGQHRQRGGQHHQEGDHPVAELDHLVHDGHFGVWTGVKLPGKHCGHVGQPRPEAVTRTIAPVTAMPPCVRMTAAAMRR